MKPKLLVSACLMGEKCRYDGKDNLLEKLDALKEIYELVGVCPEVMGGLPTPRIPCERKNSQVINQQGENKIKEFNQGANVALYVAYKEGINKALLQERSPSCGVHTIYDGSFQQRLIPGKGVTTELLQRNGIKVYSTEDIDTLLLLQEKPRKSRR